MFKIIFISSHSKLYSLYNLYNIYIYNTYICTYIYLYKLIPIITLRCMCVYILERKEQSEFLIFTSL